MADDSPNDPKENPVSDGHLPVSGEIGGPVAYHDPATTDTKDDPYNDPVFERPSTTSDDEQA
ncbi:MAG TPA: hypothetical protein VK978_00475 [Candidatus Saccharimonadales bacterium]|nr:hypothetical protein [Candidatus Saccharimonadales bacterium]